MTDENWTRGAWRGGGAPFLFYFYKLNTYAIKLYASGEEVLGGGGGGGKS